MATSVASGSPALRGRTAVVVGSGVIGLTSALRLLEAGASVEVVSSDSFPMVSVAACAFWLPAWVPGTTADMLGGAVDRSVVEPSWRAYAALREREGLSAGIRSVVNREYLDADQDDPPAWLRELLGGSVIEPVDLECDGHRYSRCWSFESVVIDMERYLEWLRTRAKSRGVVFRDELLSSLEVPGGAPDVVVNCSGLGARRLVEDTDVTPVRGHLVHFKTDSDTHAALEAVAINEYYLIPRIDDVVVGGLLREEADPDTTEPRRDPDDEALLMSKVDVLCRMAGARSGSLRRTDRPPSVGLRPRRRGGFRLEVDHSWPTPVVHNYGHGGGGVTLARGCADRVVELVAAEFAHV